MHVRICNKCLISKTLDEFSLANRNSSRRYLACKECRRTSAKKWKIDNKVKHSLCKKEWRAANRAKVRSSNSKWRKLNINYDNDRYLVDTNFRIAKILRSRIRLAINREWRRGSAVRDLGCSIEELKKHLESKFQPGMTWDNYGKGWHIDHIVPLSSFDLSNREEFLKACYYTNLQPLWAKDNLAKHAKVV